MRRPISAVVCALLAAAACDNSDLTSEYGKASAGGAAEAGGAGPAGGAAGASSVGGGGHGPTGGSGGTSPGGNGGANAGGNGGAQAGSSGSGGAGKGGSGGTGGNGGSNAGTGGGGTSGQGGKGGASGTGGGGKGGSGGGQGGVPSVGGMAGTGGSAAGMGGSPAGMGGSPAGMGGTPAGGSPGGNAGTTGGAAGGGGPSVCGNGVTEAGEECDEGSGVEKNGCYPTCTKSVPLTTGTYTEAPGDVLSPERGYLDDIDLTTPKDYSYVRTNGNTVADAPVLLDAFTSTPLSAGFLSTLDQSLGSVETSGIKVLLVFRYNEAAGGSDAPKAIILQHISQLAPILQKHVGAIAVMEAGFIGEYGAWFNSTNGLANTADEGQVLKALLAAVPKSRDIAVRTPMQKDALFPGGTIAPGAAFDGSDKSRTAHYDDCFLSSVDDMGTYDPPIATWEDYVAKDTLYVPDMGQVCSSFPPRTDCTSAEAELAAHHFSLISGYYNQTVIAAWKAQGCWDRIRAHLGYRLVMSGGSYSQKTAPGGALGVRFHLQNKGYAPPYNPRPFQIVLTDGLSHRLVASVPGVDVRTFAAGSDQSFDLWFRVPTTLPPGNYEIRLLLPDASLELAAVGAHAVQLANTGVHDIVTGDNTIGTISIDPAAPGGIDPSAQTFTYLTP